MSYSTNSDVPLSAAQIQTYIDDIVNSKQNSASQLQKLKIHLSFESADDTVTRPRPYALIQTNNPINIAHPIEKDIGKSYPVVGTFQMGRHEVCLCKPVPSLTGP